MAFYGDGKHNENMEYRQIDETMKFAVDIPQLDKDEWLAVNYFETREEAIKFAQETFGADENGNICLISNL